MKVIVFDLDGTLLDAKNEIIKERRPFLSLMIIKNQAIDLLYALVD